MRVIIFGTGYYCDRTLRIANAHGCEVLCLIDNNKSKWGKEYEGYQIQPPEMLRKLDFDLVMIATSVYFFEILEQLTREYGIPGDAISDWTYFSRESLLSYYNENPECLKEDMKEPFAYIEKNNRVTAFNYSFADEYVDIPVQVCFDTEADMFYVLHDGKRMYMKKAMNSRRRVESYYRSLLMEQDQRSPHRYLSEKFSVNMEDVVLDAGVAEGNFSLDIIDQVRSLILVEAEEEWIKSLERTFYPYRDKVTILHKYLTDYDDDKHITIDTIAREKEVSFIKMDIEGAEIDALKGGRHFLSAQHHVKMDICAYHNIEDETIITGLLQEYGFSTHTTDGYMNFIESKREPKLFVRGLVQGEK